MDRGTKADRGGTATEGRTAGPPWNRSSRSATKVVLSERIDQFLLVQKGKELNINVDPGSQQIHGAAAAGSEDR